jgi:hypothetical protein
LIAIEGFRDDLVVGAECMLTWYWLADLCVLALLGRIGRSDVLIKASTRVNEPPPHGQFGGPAIAMRGVRAWDLDLR